MDRFQTFLLISAAAFFGVLLYVTNPGNGITSSSPAILEKNSSGTKNGKFFELFDKEINVILTGDIMLGRTVMTRSLDMNKPVYPFEKVAEKLKEADIVFANLENPVIENCPRSTDGFKFCADPKMVEGLLFSGIDIVNLANNHTLNYGKSGLEETKKILTDKGIKWVGDGNLEIIQKETTKFGFLGFNFIDNELSDSDLKLISESKKKVDVLIVGIHWGVEYKAKAGSHQEEIAKKVTGAGADVISGHHPHWVQNIEEVNGKKVYYSLGNFIFDQMWSEETRKGLTVKLTYKDHELVKEQKMPIYMSSWAQPEFVQ